MLGHTSHATALDFPIVNFKTLRYNPKQITLLTKVSNFSGRRLPPPGARATALDNKLDFDLKFGNSVFVRQFDENMETWSSWRQGVVIEPVCLRYPLGCYVPGYRVRCTLPSGVTSVQIYRPFLGEICRPGEHINTSPALCISRLKIAMQAYARINNSSRVRVPWAENGIPIHEVWIKSKIMSWNEGQPPEVKLLDGPFEGISWPALELLPYNPATADACIERGEHVMAPGGKIYPGKGIGVILKDIKHVDS